MAQSADGQANPIGGRAAADGSRIDGGGLLAPAFDFARVPSERIAWGRGGCAMSQHAMSDFGIRVDIKL